jgi:F-type H+-transporting ATPase subunit delta
MPSADQQAALARPFVRALLDLTANPQHADLVGEDLALLAELVKVNRDLAGMVDSPLISRDRKAESLVDRILEGRINELTLRFVRVLAEHDALALLRVLPAAFRLERDLRAGRVAVEATTATPLTDAARESLVGWLSTWLGHPVVLATQVEAALLGGLVLKVGDTLYDGSVRCRLGRMKQQVIERGIHEIQGRRNLVAD